MSKKHKINETFLNTFIEVEKTCSAKFGVASGGVNEYINRLRNARFAQGRDEVLPRLVRYTNLRNRLAHEVGALKQIDEITKADIKWLASFEKILEKKKDPISLYLRKARRYARRRRALRAMACVGVIVLIVAAIVGTVLCFLLSNKSCRVCGGFFR